MAPEVGCAPLHGAAWYQRLQAAVLSTFGGAHARHVEARRRALLAPLRGEVLELGPGLGVNLRFYDPSVRWTGIEPSPVLRERVAEEARRLGREVRVLDGVAERLPVPDASVDAVVSTLVLCTVRDVEGALREARRVLVPGGRFVFLEHVAAPRGTFARLVQRIARPCFQVAGDGCHPDRESWRAIESAGFARVELEHFRVRLPIVGPHIAGVAVN